MDYGVALLEPAVNLPRLSEILDGVGHVGRVAAMNRMTPKQMAELYEAAKGFRPLTLDHFVPAGTEPLKEVIHEGKNSLAAFTAFQKRFCRLPEKSDELGGYNHQAMGWFTGPGYFVAHDYTEPGEIGIDYYKVPSVKPEAWPAIRDNDGGFGQFVYGKMVDVMRGVSEHVSIGRAVRNGKVADNWFVLVRQP
jgi:hypothetical protein